MQQTTTPPSKLKVFLTWLLVVGVVAFFIVFWSWWYYEPAPVEELPVHTTAGSVIMLIIAAFFMCVGVAAYFVVVISNCFTQDFDQPIWNRLKAKLYVVNILVPLFPAMAIGLAVSTFLAPTLVRAGLSGNLAYMAPAMVMIGVVQIIQVWILIWAPVETRVIRQRLAAQGITAAQIDSAILVGISDPQRSSFTKLTTVEEDIGGLWIGSDQIVYCGDAEQFSLSREQLLAMERKADSGSTTMLSGITHVVLHVSMPDGSQRQIRLHAEGVWTMGQKRQAMDALAEAIARWHESAPATPPPPPPPPVVAQAT